MELEKQVASLELAKRLKELGVKQESIFAWYADRVVAHNEEHSVRVFAGAALSAFTVAELGELLPKGLAGIKSLPGTTLHVGRSYPDKWMCGYAVYVQWETSPYLSWNGCEIADTEADARAKMLIYLIENNLITI